VDSRRFFGRPKDETIAYLEHLRQRVDNIIWLDTRDSAGNTQFFVLPLVDQYRKNQLYRNLQHYDERFLANRIYAHQMAAYFDLDDENTEYDEPLCDYAEYSDRLSLSWNIGLSDFVNCHSFGELVNVYWLGRPSFPKYTSPSKARGIDINVRFSVGKASIYALHRAAVIDKVKRLPFRSTSQTFINKRNYMKELRDSKIVISPFGWGEVCYRDFEAIINGACLVKPDVSHMRTWPDVYHPNETYVPIAWDLSDLRETVTSLLKDDARREMIALQAQECLSSIHSAEGIREFARQEQSAIRRVVKMTSRIKELT
jgi:hypothetical protein